MDNQGLEAGLSYIGLVLEAAERQIAEFWAAYEERESGEAERRHDQVPRPLQPQDGCRPHHGGRGSGQADVRRARPEGQTRVGEEHRAWHSWAARSASATSKPFSRRSTRLLTPPATRRRSLRRLKPACAARRRLDGLGLQRRRAHPGPRGSCGQGDSDSASPAEGRRNLASQTTGATNRDPATDKQTGRNPRTLATWAR